MSLPEDPTVVTFRGFELTRVETCSLGFFQPPPPPPSLLPDPPLVFEHFRLFRRLVRQRQRLRLLLLVVGNGAFRRWKGREQSFRRRRVEWTCLLLCAVSGARRTPT